MVAYSFKAKFAEPILAGIKGGTIRGDRRRHARPGEELQLYTGMRTKQCRLIGRRTCVAVDLISMDFGANPRISIGETEIARMALLDRLAVFDGFHNFDDMAAFWKEEHDIRRWAGWHIRWLPLPDGIGAA
ncbi:MAG: ASCH domain-containing protein [Pseudomonadota bacterium]|nr:ASCH domain-containing protein [Pseudomonadota bacterium]